MLRNSTTKICSLRLNQSRGEMIYMCWETLTHDSTSDTVPILHLKLQPIMGTGWQTFSPHQHAFCHVSHEKTPPPVVHTQGPQRISLTH